jgi:predicted nucleic acid-binding protein
MTRYGIDALTAVRLVREGIVVSDRHQLVAPTLLRSQALSMIYGEVRAGELGETEAKAMLERLTTMKVRLLGDRVSRGTAWRIARQLDEDDTAGAEYVAVAKLQADAFVTLDAGLADRVKDVVALAPFEALLK